ncbi:MAG: RNB domain-containing ribonuclease [SAR324 cluster bacterium]|nr:RNB domain-containing ribonuclease [SAR324 cluster bacterium]
MKWSIPVSITESSRIRILLEHQIHEIQEIRQQQDLQIIHELLVPDQEYTLEELAENFLDSPQPVPRLALLIALLEDNLWFKRTRHQTFIPRTSAELELIETQTRQARKLAAKSIQIQKWIMQLDQQQSLSVDDDPDLREWLQQLRSVLIQAKESPHWKEISTLMNWNTLERDDECKIRKWLLQSGMPVSWCRLLLEKSQIRDHVSQNVLEEATSIAEILHEKSPSSNAECLTIDSEKTRDYDDAFSVLSWNDQQLTIVVYITDVADRIAPESLVFEDARKKISTVYTLRQIFPMLPEILSNQALSLVAHKNRPAIAFTFEISATGTYQINAIRSETIQVSRNLSYNQADEYVRQETDYWPRLFTACQALMKRRIENGALELERREVEMDISNPDQIKIIPLDRNSPSNLIIQELAILVNHETARYLSEKKYPAIFRTQPPYEIVKQPQPGESLEMRHIQIDPARLTTVPGRHSGLGCDVYTQVTSPIRRFTDLIVQHQLKQSLANGPSLFDEEKLMVWAQQAELQQKTYAQIEREITAHWKIRYLSQHIGEPFKATILRHKHHATNIELKELLFVLSLPGLTSYQEGDEILLQIDHVDRERHIVQAHVVSS